MIENLELIKPWLNFEEKGDQFKKFVNDDVYFYLNDSICDSFIGMVSADILVTSASSLSYIAALISDGEIHYKKFWHNPIKNWIIYQ